MLGLACGPQGRWPQVENHWYRLPSPPPKLSNINVCAWFTGNIQNSTQISGFILGLN